MKAYVGIDPGSSSGCIAIILDSEALNEREYHTIEFSKHTLREWYDKLSEAVMLTDTVVVLEKVHGMPGMGVQSVTAFAKNVGHIEMALVVNGLAFHEVTPQKWMKHYGLRKEKDESKTEWKRRLREHLQRIMPDFKATNDTADAMLIANYAREVYK